jgi:hypothetical protein
MRKWAVVLLILGSLLSGCIVGVGGRGYGGGHYYHHHDWR